MSDASIDWAALYQKHRKAMFGAAREVLRGSGRVDLAEDAVQNAMVSLMQSPPTEAPRSWEALLVATAKRRALDMATSAYMSRRAPLSEDVPETDHVVVEDEVLERLETLAVARAVLARRDDRTRTVFREVVVFDRPRAEVAAELGVTPPRISQIVTEVLAEIRAAVEKGG
ncbi:sigma-70 family RNA polymerase sigma factor [Microbacterium schleiferi]|uniref:Sigma-70 family RNA polymerase sigma factor n=1 Tax=Microbacterium schleiferi TaxID=69362 RepID=A0ABU7V9N0_9MICO